MNIIYCGKKSVGKSTYIEKQHGNYVDFYKFIWSHLEKDTVTYLKNKINASIKETNFRSYKRHLALISEHVKLEELITEANKISTVFEMASLGMWWDLLPHKLRYYSFIYKVDCSEEVRAERAKKHGCLDTLEQFDLFYRDPPIIHNTIMA